MITVYGSSDDLIEIEGDINEEFNVLSDTGHYLAFSNGVVLRIEYTDPGVWRITPVTGDEYAGTIQLAPEGDEYNYSDRATIKGDISWVVLGIEYKTANT